MDVTADRYAVLETDWLTLRWDYKIEYIHNTIDIYVAKGCGLSTMWYTQYNTMHRDRAGNYVQTRLYKTKNDKGRHQNIIC